MATDCEIDEAIVYKGTDSMVTSESGLPFSDGLSDGV